MEINHREINREDTKGTKKEIEQEVAEGKLRIGDWGLGIGDCPPRRVNFLRISD